MTIVEITDLIMVYNRGDVETIALRGLDCTIQRGKITLLKGRSGSGKTTLLNCVARLIKPTAGKIVVNGEDILKYPEERAADYRLSIGYVYQFFNLIPYLTAEENIELPMMIKGVPRKERQERAVEILSQLGLSARKDHYPNMLSGGEQQRVSIGAAIANKPSLLLADEPTGELDSENALAIRTLLRRLCDEQGISVIVVSHDEKMADIADHILHLGDGVVASIEKGAAGSETDVNGAGDGRPTFDEPSPGSDGLTKPACGNSETLGT